MNAKEYYRLDKILPCENQYITFLSREKGKRMSYLQQVKQSINGDEYYNSQNVADMITQYILKDESGAK